MQKKATIEGNIGVHFLKEGDMFVAYAPTLDLSTCGSSFEEASDNFDEALDILFEECSKNGTLESMLYSCGWTHEKKMKSLDWVPPQMIGTQMMPFKVRSLR